MTARKATRSSAPIPRARLRKERRWSFMFVVPLATAALIAWLGYATWMSRGVMITISMDRGHGIEPGAVVRHRDVAIGEVRELELNDDGSEVVAHVMLERSARPFARQGAQYWVVRPQLTMEEIAGLDTLIGARYLEATPGAGSPKRTFEALPNAPLVRESDPGDLEIVVKAARRAGLRRGAPVTYRQIPIGVVLSVGLTSDGGAVEARVHIRQAYASLITTRTRFWSAAGIQADLGLTGLQLELESVQSLFAGGIALATPPGEGDPVTTGHRFTLAMEIEEDWLEWEPQVVIGSDLLPPGAPMPHPLRGKLSWRQGRIGNFLKTDRNRSGWLLLVGDADGAQLLGPSDLLTEAEKAVDGTGMLEIAGVSVNLSAADPDDATPLTRVDADAIDHPRWSAAQLRRMTEPEDCIIVGDMNDEPLPVAADRFRTGTHPEVDEEDMPRDSFHLDLQTPLDVRWHGAVVVARSDGAVVGVVLIIDDDDDTPPWVARIPEAWSAGD